MVLGEENSDLDILATLEVLRSGGNNSKGEGLTTFDLDPSLSCGGRTDSIALPVDEGASAEGQVLLLGGIGDDFKSKGVAVVDLATGACTPQPPLPCERWCFAGGRLRDGRVVCAGGSQHGYMEDDVDMMHPASVMAEVLESPQQGSPDDVWKWR